MDEENIPICRGENRRLFAQGNQATSNEPIIKWNCLPSSGSRGGHTASLGGLGTPVFITTIMLIYLPVFLSSLSPFLRLSLSLSLSLVKHGCRLHRAHRRRQFGGHTKRVDNLKGKSSLLTQEGHGTANAARAPPPVLSSIMRWIPLDARREREREPLGTVFRSVGGAQHYHMNRRPPDPRRSALHLTFSRVVRGPPTTLLPLLCLSLS